MANQPVNNSKGSYLFAGAMFDVTLGVTALVFSALATIAANTIFGQDALPIYRDGGPTLSHAQNTHVFILGVFTMVVSLAAATYGAYVTLRNTGAPQPKKMALQGMLLTILIGALIVLCAIFLVPPLTIFTLLAAPLAYWLCGRHR